MKVSMKSPEPEVDPALEQAAAAAMAELEQELAGIDQAEQARVAQVERTRALKRAVSEVESAKTEIGRVERELARLVEAATALRKVGKAANGVPAGVQGAAAPSLTQDRFDGGVPRSTVDDIGEHLGAIVGGSLALIQQRVNRLTEDRQRFDNELRQAQQTIIELSRQ